MKAFTWLLAAMLLAPVALAQDDALEEAPEVRRYTVEIIVFGYAEDVAVGTEMFPADEPVVLDDPYLPAGTELLTEDTLTGPELIAETDTTETSENFEGDGREEDEVPMLPVGEPVLMIDDEFSMQRIADKLELLDAYAPLMHVGWTQATLPEEEPQALELAYFGAPPEGLAGSFTLYLGRYLHLVVDLVLDAPTAEEEEQDPFAAEPAFSYGDARLQYEPELLALDAPVRYRIKEDRIVKNGDIRYFDHPKFGVIAKVTRVEEPEDELDEYSGPYAQPSVGGISQ